MEYIFKQAKPVWGTDLKNRYNQFLGFYAEIKEHRKIRIAIAARSSYRLFVNGKLYAFPVNGNVFAQQLLQSGCT